LNVVQLTHYSSGLLHNLLKGKYSRQVKNRNIINPAFQKNFKKSFKKLKYFSIFVVLLCGKAICLD